MCDEKMNMISYHAISIKLHLITIRAVLPKVRIVLVIPDLHGARLAVIAYLYDLVRQSRKISTRPCWHANSFVDVFGQLKIESCFYPTLYISGPLEKFAYCVILMPPSPC